MFLNRVFDRSLLISITFHACLGIIFYFVTFPYHLPKFKIIEISIVKLPEKKEPEILKPKPIVQKRKILGVVEEKPTIKDKPIKKSIVTRAKPQVVQEVKEIITPTTIPPAAIGIKKNEGVSEMTAAKEITGEGISQTEAEKGLPGASIPASIGETKGREEESRGPDVYISGPASKRKALYQPKFKLPSWLEKTGQSLEGKLNIWVLPDGSVDRVEIEKSFGYAEIDRLAQSAIYKWRFYKLPPDVKRTDMGVVIITIRLE